MLRFISMTWRPIILYNHQFGSCIKGPHESSQSRGTWCIFCLRRTCDGVHSDACWCYIPMSYTYNYNCPEPKWNWSSKSHLAVINHHESPLDCHKSHSIPNFYRPKMPRNPPIKGWNPPFSHLFGAMFRGERCFEVDWHNSHLTSLLPEEVRAYRSGKNGWDLLESTVIDGGSSWKLMLKMLTFRNLLVIYDSYGDLIWSNDI